MALSHSDSMIIGVEQEYSLGLDHESIALAPYQFLIFEPLPAT